MRFSSHHPHVVLFGLDRCHHVHTGRVEVVQVMLHQHAYPEAHRVRRIAKGPAPDGVEQLGAIPLEHLGGHLVAGYPVVHVWDETLDFPQAGLVVAQFRDNEGVELVLVEVGVRKVVQEDADVFSLDHPLCKRT